MMIIVLCSCYTNEYDIIETYRLLLNCVNYWGDREEESHTSEQNDIVNSFNASYTFYG